MTRLQADFKDFLRLLNANRVEYLLIGATCHARRVDALIDGLSVPVIDLANLRLNKEASGRFKDLNDLENLPVPDEGSES